MTSTTARYVTHDAVDRALSQSNLSSFQRNLLLLTGLVWTAESMEMLLLSFISNDLRCTFNISSISVALLTTSVGIGMILGNLLLGTYSDRRGRKPSILVSTFCTGLFGIISAASPNYIVLLLARFGVGFGIGGCIVAVNVLTEMTPVDKRGEFNLILGAYWSVGAIIEALFATLVLPHFSWRVLVGLTALPSIAVWLYVYAGGMPESVPWLVSKGRHSDAIEVLHELGAQVEIEEDQEKCMAVSTESDALLKKEKQNVDKLGQIPPSESMWTPGIRYIAVLICWLYFVSAFLYYGLILLQPETLALSSSSTTSENVHFLIASNTSIIGVPSIPAHQTATATGTCDVPQLTTADFLSTFYASIGELPGIILMIFTLSLLGRRPLISYSMALTSALFIILIFYSSNYVIQTVLFFAARGLCIGFFQAVIIYTSEFYPSLIKSSSVGVASAFSRIGILITPFVAQVLTHLNVSVALLTYAVVGLVGAFAVWFVPVETTGRHAPESVKDLVEVLEKGDCTGEFKEDQSVHNIIRWLRWSAKVDAHVKQV